jgi:two-component system phosphate regulon response regulator PhoB
MIYMTEKILVVEDEDSIREMLLMTLTRAGFEAMSVGSVSQARGLIMDKRPNLILLDWMLPDVSGIEYARSLKKDVMTREIPIIMVTARGSESDRIKGLEVGADDYITKPFSPKELVARIKTVLRRGAPLDDNQVIQVEGLRVDMAGHRVMINNTIIELGPTEFRLLHFFITHPDRVYSRGQLLDQVWGGSVFIGERAVDVHIRRLRQALATHQHDQYVQTVRGSGYRFSVLV